MSIAQRLSVAWVSSGPPADSRGKLLCPALPSQPQFPSLERRSPQRVVMWYKRGSAGEMLGMYEVQAQSERSNH